MLLAVRIYSGRILNLIVDGDPHELWWRIDGGLAPQDSECRQCGTKINRNSFHELSSHKTI